MGTTAYGGKGSKGRAANGDRPVGAASCRRDHHTMPPPPPPPLDPPTHIGAWLELAIWALVAPGNFEPGKFAKHLISPHLFTLKMLTMS